MLTLVPVAIPEEASKAAGVSGFVLPMANLGGAGMFVGIVTSIIAVEIYRVTDKSKFKITMPDNVPPAVARSFESLTPTLIVMLLIGSITYYLGFDWHICRELSRTTSSSSGLFIECLVVSLFNNIFSGSLGFTALQS